MSESYAVPAVTPAPEPATERIGKGTLAALLTIPVGVALWVVVWGFGFIASLIGAVVAVLALRLYVWGAGRISRLGALVVLVVTAFTLVLAFFGGIVLDAAKVFGEESGLGAWGAFTHPDFWPLFMEVLPDALPEYLPDFGWALAFGALGSFATLRTAFAAARVDTTAQLAAPSAPAPVEQAPIAQAPVEPMPAAAVEIPGATDDAPPAPTAQPAPGQV